MIRGKRGQSEPTAGGVSVSLILLLALLAILLAFVAWLIFGNGWATLKNYVVSTGVDNFVSGCNLKASAWSYDYCCTTQYISLGSGVYKTLSCWTAQSLGLAKLNSPGFSCDIAGQCKDLLCPSNGVYTKGSCASGTTALSTATWYLNSGTYVPIEQGYYCCVNSNAPAQTTTVSCAASGGTICPTGKTCQNQAPQLTNTAGQKLSWVDSNGNPVTCCTDLASCK